MIAHLDPGYGAAYLQSRIDAEFVLARHLGLSVDSADDVGVTLSAPLAPNANDKGTAFGGSLFSVAVLTGWAWLARHLAARRIDAYAVIQESTMRYIAPVRGRFSASLAAPAAADVEKFERMLRRAGRGRIRLHVAVHEGRTLVTRFEGLYAAAMRQRKPGESKCREN